VSADPVLVLQMQRLGDIILSFPLFLWLKRQRPDRPVFVVAEPSFYNELLNVSPGVTYLPWTATGELASRRWGLIVNLSHRPEAAALCGAIETGQLLGPALVDGSLRVRGRWQLYRATLTHNNRHNRFHWADLFALGCVDKGQWRATRFDPPRDPAGDAVGLFVGASQEDKRPDAPFWAALARECERRGLKPVLLGGPADQALGREIKALHGGALADFCGRLGLREFAAAGQTLALMITPDTGPMHLAAWTGLATLNLSMGPVNPWETGPHPPGHHVLRADISCQDCWQCRFERPRCKARFDPAQVAYLARRIVEGARLPALPGMRLWESGRTPEGLYDLVPRHPREPSASDLLGELWRGAFGDFFGLWDQERTRQARRELVARHPGVAVAFARELERLARDFRTVRGEGGVFPAGYWAQARPMLRPLTGYLQMRLENEDYGPDARAACLDFFDRLRNADAQAPARQSVPTSRSILPSK